MISQEKDSKSWEAGSSSECYAEVFFFFFFFLTSREVKLEGIAMSSIFLASAMLVKENLEVGGGLRETFIKGRAITSHRLIAIFYFLV